MFALQFYIHFLNNFTDSFVRQVIGNTSMYLTLLNDGNLAIYDDIMKTDTLL